MEMKEFITVLGRDALPAELFQKASHSSGGTSLIRVISDRGVVSCISRWRRVAGLFFVEDAWIWVRQNDSRGSDGLKMGRTVLCFNALSMYFYNWALWTSHVICLLGFSNKRECWQKKDKIGRKPKPISIQLQPGSHKKWGPSLRS